MLSDFTAAANTIAATTRKSEKERTLSEYLLGLDDAEIDRLTAHFKATTTARYGPVHAVAPQIVLEIAFDRIQESKRHKSGYALRFPRIANIRDDKTVEQISTIDELRRIYEGRLKREQGIPPKE